MSKNNLVTVLVVMIAVVAVGYGFNNHFKAKEETLVSISKDIAAEQEAKLGTLLAGLRTGGDSYAESVKIADCNKESRIIFDELLSNLSSLNREELSELDQIFNSCAYYYSTVQTVTVAKLAREVEVYKDNLRVLATFDTEAKDKLEKISVWNDIVAKEKERGLMHTSLVDVQSKIVDELLNYKSVQNPDVQNLVANGQEIRENILFLTQQIDELKASIDE